MSDDYLRKGESLKQMEARNFKNYKGAAEHLEKKRGEIKSQSKTKALDKAKVSKKETKKDYIKRHGADLMKYETN